MLYLFFAMRISAHSGICQHATVYGNFRLPSSPHPHAHCVKYCIHRNKVHRHQYASTTTAALEGSPNGVCATIPASSSFSLPVPRPATFGFYPWLPVRHRGIVQQAHTTRSWSFEWQGQDIWTWSQGSKAAWQGTGGVPGRTDSR